MVPVKNSWNGLERRESLFSLVSLLYLPSLFPLQGLLGTVHIVPRKHMKGGENILFDTQVITENCFSFQSQSQKATLKF